ncbi:alpha-mannosidase [Bifidobacterium sp. SMA15]|uniref:Alpha-mannosidase n=2 Tax=Bifidobacterium platyrrhinorum TaxID=2661628 RepID=A0A6L9SUR8_9BIFI|nr:alpha-mannosidase [Bifidobacterium platyrrhinorum]
MTYDEKVTMRVERAIRQHLADAVYPQRVPVSIECWKVGGEPVPFETAKNAQYRPFEVGETWGAAWDTWWFHVTGTVPASWKDIEGTRPELVVDLGRIGLGPGFQAEGLARTPDGEVVKAIEPYNAWVPLPEPGEPFEFYIEAAANPQIPNGFPYLPTDLGDEGVKDGPELYRMQRMDASLLDLEVWQLTQELKVLLGLGKETDPQRTRHADIMIALENAVDRIDPNDVHDTAAAARKALVDVLAAPAPDKGHTAFAVGHAHIDTAWLWPLRETKRKVARTFSNVVELTDEDDDFVFAASSAQQYKWLKENYPEVFAKVRRKVDEGKFIPVGGMWVECDANMPSGESLARQFLQGTRFFEENLGGCSPVVWLPDSFGYSGAFPQIARLAGYRYFLTQKISWNDTNTFPHHTFLWQGIDGTEIFTHFPPSDTYNSDMSPADVAKTERQYSEKGKGASSLMLFGWGDGGGGPTREMLASAHLQRNIEGAPKVRIATPLEFFEQAERELEHPARWNGELYLELHRGTLTSQSHTKHGNRRTESLLREAETWATAATVLEGRDYPYEELAEIWQRTLLYQFHDILPGSAIAWVYSEVERNYADMERRLEAIIAESIEALAGKGDRPMLANAAPLAQLGAPAAGIASAPVSVAATATALEDGAVRMGNEHVSFTLDDHGRIISAVDLKTGREAIDPSQPGNDLQLFVDAPAEWDAWDIEKGYENGRLDAVTVSGSRLGEDGVMTVEGVIGNSPYTQTIGLDDDVDALTIRTHIDWKESDRLLKQAFPVRVYATEAQSEIQYGHITRPIHRNTTWDEARFETLAHRWVHVEEGDFGVGIANMANYGNDIQQITMADGRPGTRIRLSLLRAPHFPAPHADVGKHDFAVSFTVGAGTERAIAQGYRLNVPAREVLADHEVAPFVSVDGEGVLVEAVKMAEDRSGDVIVRLYESLGTQSAVTLRTGFAWRTVSEVGLLERECDAVRPAVMDADSGKSSVDIQAHPFQIVTLRFSRA